MILLVLLLKNAKFDLQWDPDRKPRAEACVHQAKPGLGGHRLLGLCCSRCHNPGEAMELWKMRTESRNQAAELSLPHRLPLGSQPCVVLTLCLVWFRLCLNLLVAQHQAATLEQGALLSFSSPSHYQKGGGEWYGLTWIWDLT